MKSMELTEADWDLFLAGAKQKRYRKGEFVLEEGQPTAALFQAREPAHCRCCIAAHTLHPRLHAPQRIPTTTRHPAGPQPGRRCSFRHTGGPAHLPACSPTSRLQILSGNLRVELRLKNQPAAVVVGHRSAGDMFGETSLLKAGLATASVATDSDSAVVMILEAAYLDALFQQHPALPGRFFAFLAQYQARAHRRSSQPHAPPRGVALLLGVACQGDEVTPPLPPRACPDPCSPPTPLLACSGTPLYPLLPDPNSRSPLPPLYVPQARRLRQVTDMVASASVEMAGRSNASVLIADIFSNPAYMGIFRKFMFKAAEEEPEQQHAYAMSLAMFEFWMDVQVRGAHWGKGA